MDEPRLDLTSEPPPPREGDRKAENPRYLGIVFTCCQVYGRIAPDHSGRAYVGHCPKCARSLRIGIGPGGTSQRFFMAR